MAAFGKSLTTVGKSLLKTGLVLSAPFVFAAKSFADFDDQMRQVRAVTQASEEQFTSLTKKARELGATTSFTAQEVAALMAELGRAGFKPEEVEEMTGAILNLARATGTDATRAAEVAAATLRQFGLGADQAGRVADVLTAAANKSAVSVDGLGFSLEYAAPVAASLGVSLEDTVALISALGNVGIKGSSAGTAVRRLLILTAAEAEEFNKIFGVSMRDATGAPRNLIDVLEDLDAATRNLDPLERSAKFSKFFGLLGITGASALSRNALGVRELQAALKDVAGTADRSAREMDAGLGGTLRMLQSAFAEVVLVVGEALAPTLQQIFQAITANLGSFGEWVKQNRALVLIAAAAGPVLIALGGALIVVGTSVTAAASAFGVLATVVGALATPLGIVAAGIAAVGAIALSQSGSVAQLGKVFGSVAQTALTAWQGIQAAIQSGDLRLAVEIAGKGIELAWQTVISALQKAWMGFRDWLVDLWDQMASDLAEHLLTVFELILAQAPTQVGLPKVDREGLQAEIRRISEIGREQRRRARDEAAAAGDPEIRRLQQELDALVQKAKDAADAAKNVADQANRGLGALVGGIGAAASGQARNRVGLGLALGGLGLIPAGAQGGAGGFRPPTAEGLDLAGATARGTFSAAVAGRLGGETPILVQAKKQTELLEKIDGRLRRIELDGGAQFG